MPNFADGEPGPSKRPRVDEEECSDSSLEPSGNQDIYSSPQLQDGYDPYPIKVAPFPVWLDSEGTVSDEPVQDPDLSFLDI